MALITQAVNSKGVLKLKMSKAFNRVEYKESIFGDVRKI